VTAVLAHGVGGVETLPLPLGFVLAAGAVVLALSFGALGILWRRPRLDADAPGRPLPEWLQDVLFAPILRVVLGVLSLGLLGLVVATALAGDRSSSDNLAPTFVYVVFWLGIAALSVLLGNVWRVLSPWRAAADAVAWIAGRAGWTREPLPYPERLGCWPAAVGLLAFATLELAYSEPSDPRAVGMATLVYSALTWSGALVFGREAWFRNGDAFGVYFELLSRLAPFGVSVVRGQLTVVLRRPLAALAARDLRPGAGAVIAVMVGSVGFDSFGGGDWWQARLYDVQEPYLVTNLDLAELLSILVNLGGLLAWVLGVAATYALALAVSRAFLPAGSRLGTIFVGSLVPIAFVYALAHYFSLLVLQGQFTARLASDPFGWEWDLFGTSDVTPDLGILTPNSIWYTQVAALVAGHVVALTVAHDRAISLTRSGAHAVVSQLPMLLLMVVYTLTGLWLLSQVGE
jgi:hypothetical protein